MTPLQVRFLTWNVHGCVGRDRVRDPDRVAHVLEAAQPDISALQEIDNRTTSAARDPFSYFGELFGWTSVAARTLAARDGHYGHIVLSRWPIESLGELDLSVRWREPRKAIVGAVTTPAGRIIVVAAHLGLLPFERRRQLARLKERIAAIPDRPIVVLGDSFVNIHQSEGCGFVAQLYRFTGWKIDAIAPHGGSERTARDALRRRGDGLPDKKVVVWMVSEQSLRASEGWAMLPIFKQ